LPGAFSIGQEATTTGSPTEKRRNIPERISEIILLLRERDMPMRFIDPM